MWLAGGGSRSGESNPSSSTSRVHHPPGRPGGPHYLVAAYYRRRRWAHVDKDKPPACDCELLRSPTCGPRASLFGRWLPARHPANSGDRCVIFVPEIGYTLLQVRDFSGSFLSPSLLTHLIGLCKGTNLIQTTRIPPKYMTLCSVLTGTRFVAVLICAFN